MMIRRAAVIVALLGLGLGACATDDPGQENGNQANGGDEQDVEDEDLDVRGD